MLTTTSRGKLRRTPPVGPVDRAQKFGGFSTIHPDALTVCVGRVFPRAVAGKFAGSRPVHPGASFSALRTMTAARYRCHRCGKEFGAWAPAERHADSDRHCRIELMVDPQQEEPAMPNDPKETK